MALTDTFVRQVKHNSSSASSKHADGQGMYLLVTAAGKYWRFDYRFNGKRKTAALGTYPEVSLAKARQRRQELRELLADNIDPSAEKRERMRDSKERERQTFTAVAREWLEKTKAQRAATTQLKVSDWLTRNLFPQIGAMPISQIKPRDVLLALERMEARGAIESAHRVKQLCGQVFRYAVAVGLAERDVTADLRGALAAIPRTHYAAITEPTEVGKLMRAIHGYRGHPYATAALRLSPLLFVRPGELRSAEWCEVDLEGRVWRIPGQKMKMKNDHIVPLATQAIEILKSIQPMTGHGKFIFPNIRTEDRCMSENTINACLRSLGYSKEVMTAHGFRAMARTILDEVLEERVDFIEHQLAHAVKDANGRAYNRTAHLPARHLMMQRWADYLDVLQTTTN